MQTMSMSCVAVFMTCSLACVLATEDERQRVFVRGLEAFDQAQTPAQFQEVARLFESLLSNGYANGSVCYNLGNAYVRAGRVGPAIAAYRRAQRLLPRDPYVQANLDAALASAPEAVRPGEVPWWKRMLLWHSMLAQRERLGLATSMWMLAFALGSLRLLAFPTAGMARTWLGRCAVLTLAAGALLSASAVLGHFDEQVTRRAVVTEETTARKGNGATYAPAFDRVLKEGAECLVLEQRNGWVHLQFAGAGAGWVPEKCMTEY